MKSPKESSNSLVLLLGKKQAAEQNLVEESLEKITSLVVLSSIFK